MANICVGNCPFDITEQQRGNRFGAHGEITKVSVITGGIAGRPREYAFVETADGGGGQDGPSQ